MQLCLHDKCLLSGGATQAAAVRDRGPQQEEPSREALYDPMELGGPSMPMQSRPNEIKVLEIPAFSSVHDMIHAAIISYGSQATLREIYRACEKRGRIAYKRSGGSRLITHNDHWKSQIRHALYTCERFARSADSADSWTVSKAWSKVVPQTTKVLVRTDAEGGSISDELQERSPAPKPARTAARRVTRSKQGDGEAPVGSLSPRRKRSRTTRVASGRFVAPSDGQNSPREGAAEEESDSLAASGAGYYHHQSPCAGGRGRLHTPAVGSSLQPAGGDSSHEGEDESSHHSMLDNQPAEDSQAEEVASLERFKALTSEERRALLAQLDHAKSMRNRMAAQRAAEERAYAASCQNFQRLLQTGALDSNLVLNDHDALAERTSSGLQAASRVCRSGGGMGGGGTADRRPHRPIRPQLMPKRTIQEADLLREMVHDTHEDEAMFMHVERTGSAEAESPPLPQLYHLRSRAALPGFGQANPGAGDTDDMAASASLGPIKKRLKAAAKAAAEAEASKAAAGSGATPAEASSAMQDPDAPSTTPYSYLTPRPDRDMQLGRRKAQRLSPKLSRKVQAEEGLEDGDDVDWLPSREEDTGRRGRGRPPKLPNGSVGISMHDYLRSHSMALSGSMPPTPSAGPHDGAFGSCTTTPAGTPCLLPDATRYTMQGAGSSVGQAGYGHMGSLATTGALDHDVEEGEASDDAQRGRVLRSQVVGASGLAGQQGGARQAGGQAMKKAGASPAGARGFVAVGGRVNTLAGVGKKERRSMLTREADGKPRLRDSMR
ncbi:hypothetical protein WJX72_004461 [[Myrmecia] bisecta]|uniref:Uncharacterized protein n=1 Tax=[Myrmecia] bisecta TaxID=41462 RepID=A0AAW1Q439_9CHLO